MSSTVIAPSCWLGWATPLGWATLLGWATSLGWATPLGPLVSFLCLRGSWH